jgi:hypothetical protein
MRSIQLAVVTPGLELEASIAELQESEDADPTTSPNDNHFVVVVDHLRSDSLSTSPKLY